MNYYPIAVSICDAIKRLKDTGNLTPRSEWIFLKLTGQTLSVAVLKGKDKGATSVETTIPNPFNWEFFGCIPKSSLRLIEYCATYKDTSWELASDDLSSEIRISRHGDGSNSFVFAFKLTEIAPKIDGVIFADTVDHYTVNSDQAQTSQVATSEKNMIAIANDYFQDLNAAIEAGVIPNGKRPKKADLYAAIDAHNDELVKKFVQGNYKSQYTITPSEPIALTDMIKEVKAERQQQSTTSKAKSRRKPVSIKPAPAIEVVTVAADQIIENETIDDRPIVTADQPIETKATIATTGNPYADLLSQWKAKKSEPAKKSKNGGPSKLDLLVQAMEDGVTDVEELAARSGMKPGGVKGWVGVIKNQGIDNWRKSTQQKRSA
jgi:hypothetical protein